MNFDALLKTFKVQPELNKIFWDQNKMLNPTIRLALLKVAEYFYDSIKLDKKPVIKDIVFTGSLANYNYSKYSDIDLHLLFDFEEMEGDMEMIEQFFTLAKANWNDQHDVSIKGYPVEVYAEDYRSPHISTGLFSVMKNQWIKEPQKVTPVVDKLDVKTKVNYVNKLYNHFLTLYKQHQTKGLDANIHKLREKIRQYRQAGLDRGGEFSTENIAFKVMRRVGLLDKLKELQNAVVDANLTVKEIT
jgi:hypothetical protein